MHWKTKRLIGTIIAAVLPYLAWVWISFDAYAPLDTPEDRFTILLVSAFSAIAVFSYPLRDFDE